MNQLDFQLSAARLPSLLACHVSSALPACKTCKMKRCLILFSLLRVLTIFLSFLSFLYPSPFSFCSFLCPPPFSLCSFLCHSPISFCSFLCPSPFSLCSFNFLFPPLSLSISLFISRLYSFPSPPIFISLLFILSFFCFLRLNSLTFSPHWSIYFFFNPQLSIELCIYRLVNQSTNISISLSVFPYTFLFAYAAISLPIPCSHFAFPHPKLHYFFSIFR